MFNLQISFAVCLAFYVNSAKANVIEDLINCPEPPLECPNVNITFFLYTRSTQDSPYQLNVTDNANLKKAPFNPNVMTKILIHGYTGYRDYSPNTELRPAYFKHGEYNIISVDWNPLARSPCYIQAVANVDLVGRCVAQLMDVLVANGIATLKSIHIIGFSLGAQAAGRVANWIKSGVIEWITGLDPALILFVTLDDDYKLDASDAKHVQVTHTNALQRGKLEQSGHVDFYANGGTTQPGCKSTAEMSKSSCNHARAPQYYAESITSDLGFYATKCPTWVLYKLGMCHEFGLDHEELYGEFANKSLRGPYFFDTNSESPYAKGPNKNEAQDDDLSDVVGAEIEHVGEILFPLRGPYFFDTNSESPYAKGPNKNEAQDDDLSDVVGAEIEHVGEILFPSVELD